MLRRTILGGAPLAALGACASKAAVSPARLVQIDSFPAAAIDPRPVSLWLPPGYDDSRARYPVLYMHDGQNIFEPGRAFGGEEWGVDEAMAALTESGSVRPAIVVGVWNTEKRWREYAPAKVVASLGPQAQAVAASKAGGAPISDAYVRFLVTELKPYIDGAYRTRQGRDSTFLMGSSMGGLISLYAMAEAPETFGAAACLSIHWPLAAPGDDQFRNAVIRAFRDYLTDAPLDPKRHRLWIDQGTIGLDASYGPYREALEPAFAAKGFSPGPRFQSRVYEGADHNEAAWRARLAEPLRFLLG